MFDTFSRSFGSIPSQRADIDVATPPEPTPDPFFGAIASYQICGCCGRFHGATDATDGGGLGVVLNGDDRGVFGPNGKPSLDIIDAGGQITRSNMSWATGLGQAAVVTYAYRASASVMPTDTTGFTQFNSFQIAATELALAAWSDVANITFNRVTDTGSQYSNNATILFGNYASGQSGAAAFAYLPGGMPGATAAGAVQGDVWINSSLGYNTVPTMQGYGQQVLLHEIGHAIGLSHPAAYNASANGVITYSANATYFEDSRQYTVMSYFSERETGADFRDGVGNNRYSSVPLLDDIAAAQRLYGANMNTRTGDTVYGFNSNAGQPWFTANNSLSALIFAVWDAGGTDTFDFSGYSVAQTIDLRQGAFSSVGGLVGNVAIALGVVIENVIGGTGADTIRGNSAANLITSNGGNDEIDGGLGSDTVVFAGARSSYTISWNGQVGTITGLGQTVTVSNVEFLQFSDQTVAAAPTGGLLVGGDATDESINGTAFADTIGGLGGDDTINGQAGADTLDGGSGDDVLNGGDGDDVLIGGRGDDALNGGAGHDIADYTDAGSGITLNLATGMASGGGGADTLSGIEEVRGTAHTDTITGDANANILHGGGGVDTLNGGGGADKIYAGAPGEGGGAPDIIKGMGTANNSIANAVSLAGSFDLGTRDDVADSNTIPHATVVATAHGGLEYYAVTVAAGETVVFDIDNASFDSVLRIFDGSNNRLAQNDDNAADGGPATDSGLSYTFAAAGTYYIEVSRYLGGLEQGGTLTVQPPPVGGAYTLHVSVPSATVVPVITDLGSTMNGEAGDDELNGGVGRDTLNGGIGDDLLTGGGGNDTLNGGDGTDTAVFSGNRASYTISASGGVTTVTGPDGTDSLTNVERLKFADGLFDITGAPVGSGPINGTPGADVLNGTDGADTINGLDGDDVINGKLGDDTIDGGVGTDTAVFSGTIASSTVSTVGGVTTVTGPDGTDTLTNVERLQFADGTLIVGAGGGQYFAGTPDADVITGTAFDDEIEAGAGDDLISGGEGSDVIDGGAGLDTLQLDRPAASYFFQEIDGGGWRVYDGAVQVDTLASIERVAFSGGTPVDIAVAAAASFDAYRYIAAYSDLLAVFRNAPAEAYRHYMAAGQAEGRSTTAFNPLQYVASNPDLIGLLGLDGRAASQHYAVIGSLEERSTDSFQPIWYAASNVDVAHAFGLDEQALLTHYITAGAAEGRQTASFDPLMYAASNADLARAFGMDQAALLRHFVGSGLLEGRLTNTFDPLLYAASNPDIARGFGADADGALIHYLTAGANEGRPTDTFDPLLYAASNPDIARVFGADANGALIHYLTAGADEGRPTDTFDPLLYAASNPDIARVFGADADGALIHYLVAGADEGRPTATFDAWLYAASNPDIARVFGIDSSGALNHYLAVGADEGRPTNTFDALLYAASNPDIARAYGADAVGALVHYLSSGADEGRPVSTFDPLLYLASNADLARAFGVDQGAALMHYLTTGADEGRQTATFDPQVYLNAYADLQQAFGTDARAALNHYLQTGVHEGRTPSGGWLVPASNNGSALGEASDGFGSDDQKDDQPQVIPAADKQGAVDYSNDPLILPPAFDHQEHSAIDGLEDPLLLRSERGPELLWARFWIQAGEEASAAYFDDLLVIPEPPDGVGLPATDDVIPPAGTGDDRWVLPREPDFFNEREGLQVLGHQPLTGEDSLTLPNPHTDPDWLW